MKYPQYPNYLIGSLGLKKALVYQLYALTDDEIKVVEGR